LISGNPVREHAVFEIEISTSSQIRLIVYDTLGRRVDVLASGEYPAGRHEVAWDGPSSGVYFANLQACGESITIKLVVIR
jgi:hypothetical protein